MSTEDQPHAKRRGWLKNGNLPGDPSKAPRCGAKAKRTQEPCLAPSMANGRCRLHGGKSTGAKTAQGMARSKSANWKTGRYSAEAKQERKHFRELFTEARTTIQKLKRKN